MSSTLLDRTIGYFSPTAGLRRAQARLATETMLAYEGAKQGRRGDGWQAFSTDADSESQSVVHLLRDRARDLVRNNPHAASAIDIRETEVIGTGIVAEVAHKNLAERWRIFTENCDVEGDVDFYGLQALVERCRMESGEVLVRRRYVERSRDQIRMGYVPMALQVLEPDYIDQSRDGRSPDRPGNFIRYGIEYESSGRKAGYWLYPQHPGEGARAQINSLGLTSSFVPAEDALHLFRKNRAGQSRGVTDFAPVMLRMRNLDDYDDAEVMRKKVEACLAVFVTTPGGAMTNPLLGQTSTTADGDRVERLHPGMVQHLRHGETIESIDPKSSSGYADFKRFSARDVAAGLGLPYELLTGDLTQVNYSSYRAGLVRFRRRIQKDQRHLYIWKLCNPVFEWVREESAVMAGTAGYAARVSPIWTPPRFELIDPLKETQAELEAVLAGFDTWDEVVRRRGWTSGQQLDVIEAWQSELSKRGIVLKSDHRNAVSLPSGMGAGEPPPTEPDDDDEEEQEAA